MVGAQVIEDGAGGVDLLPGLILLAHSRVKSIEKKIAWWWSMRISSPPRSVVARFPNSYQGSNKGK